MIATQPTTNGYATPSSRVNLRRNTSLTAGVLYLLTFVSMPTLVLYGPVKTANFQPSPILSSDPAIAGMIPSTAPVAVTR